MAAELSFAVGRDKVIEMTRRVGITGIRKTCSMALGDYGISPLEHAGGIATFANGGKLAKPYAILDLVSSKGDLVYSRDRDEPEAPQVVERKVAEGLNWMMNKVVTEGTGQRAQLDFTNVAGKTGTSTGPKDVWFVGFTGKYVGAVWLGNDDNRPMSGGTTGGVFASPVWHSFMSVVHTDMNIPTIPGLEPHPVQVAEQQRIAAMRPEGAPDTPEAQRTTLEPDVGSGARSAAQSRASAAQGRRHRRAATHKAAHQHGDQPGKASAHGAAQQTRRRHVARHQRPTPHDARRGATTARWDDATCCTLAL